MSENEKTEKLEYQTEEKIEGLTEPIEGEKDIESEPAQGETVDGGGSPKRKRRIVAAAVLGVAVIALCIAGIVGAATPSEAPQPENPSRSKRRLRLRMTRSIPSRSKSKPKGGLIPRLRRQCASKLRPRTERWNLSSARSSAARISSL